MDTPQKSSGLQSIRTFAKDLEMKKQSATPTTSSVAPTPIPETSLVAGDNHVYQAPTWKKRKAGPIEHQETATEKEEPPKKIPEPTLKPLTAPKSASEPTIIVDNEDAASATIIRDTKHNRFRLFPAIGSSLKQWFADLKEKYFTKKTPKYTVPETTLRKGVIQKATSKTGKIATFDHSSLQERIRERKDRVAPKTPTTTWTANTEPGYLLLEGPDLITNVQVEPRKSFRTTTPPPKPVEPTPPTAPLPEPVPTTTEEPVLQVPPVVVPEEPVQVPVIPTTTVSENSVPVRNTTPVKPVGLRNWLFSLNTNLVSLGIAGLVIALIIVSTIGYFWFRSQLADPDLIVRPNHPSLLTVPLSLLYVETLDYETMHNAINDELNRNDSGIMQLGVIATKDGTVLLPVPAILETMGFDVSAVFSRSISSLYFGKIAGGAPFIVFKATDATTARGGMLAWEESLYHDTLPILAHGASARNLSPDATFTDTIISDSDSRRLATPTGEEYLVYSLTKDNVVIITTSSTALMELFTLLQ